MASAGEILRSERLLRKRSLSELAKATCISTRYLEAIEADDARSLPGDFFHRSFIRQYALALGIEESQVKEILNAVEPVPAVDPIPAFSLPQQIADLEQRSRPLAQIPTRVAATLLVVVVFGCAGLYAIWNRAQEARDSALSLQESVAAPTVVAAPAAVAQAAPPQQAEATAPAPMTDSEPESTAGVEAGKISVDVSAKEKTWVSLSSAGKTIFKGILDPSQTKNFALEDNGKLLTGNAAGLDVRMNGRPIGPLGSRGQVRMILFTHDDYQIVSPSRM